MSNAYSIANTLKLFAIEIADISSTGLTNDSREVTDGKVFCAVIGHHQDGRKYVNAAIEQGASLIIAQCLQPEQHGQQQKLTFANRTVTQVQFYQLDQHLFALAQSYYQQPQQQLTMVGITGTNGKTSTSHFVAQLLAAKQPTAVIGTLGAGQLSKLATIKNTTPGATELNQWLADFTHQGVKSVAMEVSSHALAQKRLTGELIDIAVFTNLSRDHLDYHQTMQAYAQAKKQLFTGMANQVAVLNADDATAQQWLANWPSQQTHWCYGLTEQVTQYQHYLLASKVQHLAQGTSFTLSSHLGEVELTTSLIGDFNIANLLAAIAVALIDGIDLSALPKLIAKIKPVAGRMECFSAANKATAVVDYAHTPDALAKALQACKQHCQGELWLVFGCGGDRDQGKRPEMGTIAEQYADHVVITNDNPRTESPELIAQDILQGITRKERTTIVLDRQQAVLNALAQAKAGDIVLCAGKGHEDYTIIGEQVLDYNERAVVASFYQQGEQA